MDKYLFKIWNVHRTKKICIVLSASESDLYEQLICKANEKMGVDGSCLVLESDGTTIDDNEALTLLHKEIFIILQKNEIWLPFENQSSGNTSISTVTVEHEKSYSSCDESLCANYLSPSGSLPTVTTTEQQHGNVRIINENTWRNYEVPWHKLPGELLEDLKKGTGSKRIVNECVRMVIYDIRKLKTDLCQRTLKIVAHKMVSAYPTVFQDVDDDGEVLGDGTHTVFSKLYERNTYLNKNSKRLLVSENTENKFPRKKKSAAKAGCLEWQPAINEITDLEEKINRLNNIDIVTDIDSPMEHLLNDTYPRQRQFLNSQPTVKDIQASWPILLYKPILFWHYNKLMGHTIDIIENNLVAKSEKILKFGLNKKIITNSQVSELLLGDIEDKCIASLQVITSYFKEDFNLLVHNTTKNDPQLDIPFLHPCVLKYGYETGEEYHTVVEKLIIGGPDKFLPSLKQCYALYYILNMEYPKRLSCTLEFVQRYIMKTHPDTGTKSTYFASSKKKVITLMKALALINEN